MLAIGTRKLVTAALIEDQESNVLVGQRPVGSNYAGLWEFPGGKVQDGETPERCLERELEEELGAVSSADAIFARVRIDRAIELLVYRTRLIEGAPTAVEGRSAEMYYSSGVLEPLRSFEHASDRLRGGSGRLRNSGFFLRKCVSVYNGRGVGGV